LRILVATGQPTAREFLSEFLRERGHDVTIARDGAEAWDLLQARHFARMAILARDLEGVDGLQLCRRIRKAERGNELYLMVIEAAGGSQAVAEALQAGADAHLTTSAKVAELEAHLAAARRYVEMIEELTALRQAPSKQGTYDLLTNLDNRPTILAALRKEVARARRERGSIAAIMIDLDRFGQVNETYGRRAGDAVLTEVARRIGQTVRIYDHPGRYGDEEFLVVAPGCDGEQASELAARLRTALSSEPYRAAGRTVPVTVSIGVSAIQPVDETDQADPCHDPEPGSSRAPDETLLLDAVEQALLRAQSLGYDRIERETPAPTDVHAA
jgi:diguanylate cyclase (GGDEF)-like protein